MMEVISTRRYEARPPASAHSAVVYDPENSIATVKEEEWETRKKKEITTTRQIETRVKRQVVLEDGEIVVDSGPLVTTNTTEDVEQQEHTTQERRTTGDEPKEVEWPSPGKDGGIVQKELNETVIRSREEIEERLETEDRQQLGDISDEAYQEAVRTNRGDLRIALAESSKQIAIPSGPRVLQHTTRSNKVVDTENTLERNELKADGLIVTETKKTVEHEEIKDDELPDVGDENLKDEPSETRKESSQRFLKKRDEDVVDYVSGGEKIAREMRYVSETTEGERIGDWPPPSATMRTTRLHKHSGFTTDQAAATSPSGRKDAVTKKPLDLEEEDEARKFETSKWLESHFGSESRSSHGSIEADDPPIQTGTNTSFINVTMKSCTPARDREYSSPSYNRHQQQRRTSGRESSSPSGYFHGISEWSERYQTAEKPNNQTRTSSPSHYVIETMRSNGYNQDSLRSHQEPSRYQKESNYSRTYDVTRRQSQPEQDHRKARHEHRQRDDPPSPPARRRTREQIISRSEEKNSYNEVPIRTASPVLVVQRTWENRGKDVVQQNSTIERAEARRYSPQNNKTPPRSRSPSPIQRIVQQSRREKKNVVENVEKNHKTPNQSKYKIGESFRKLVGKLRSASSERKNKIRGGSSSTSQLTQTDDDSTYRAYNVIDRNIPLVTEDDTEEKPPERPPRSPRNNVTMSPIVKSVKTTRSNGYAIHEPTNYHRNGTSTPIHRYYVGEDPYAVSSRESYSREKVYRETSNKPPGRTRGSSRNGHDRDYSGVSNSLGRFSKSTSRLTNDYEGEDQFRSTQTLPRKLHSVGHNNSRTIRTNSRHHTGSNTIGHVKQSPLSSSNRHTGNSNNPSRQYGSMINISIKNAVTSQKPTTIASNNFQAPAKPERTYKSSLLRSKSFNIEAGRSNNENTNPSVPHKSNLQLNRLNETPPLKSPGILASISRSNRDIFKESKHEY